MAVHDTSPLPAAEPPPVADSGKVRSPSRTPHWAEWKARTNRVLGKLLDDQLAQFGPESTSQALLLEVRALADRPAKRLRPLLFLHSFHAVSGKMPGDTEFEIAAAIELTHAFILVHDDVIDRSETRSGAPTLHRAVASRLAIHHGRDRVARDLAIVLGDLVFVCAQRAVLQSGLPAETKVAALDTLLSYTGETGLGECDDILFGVWDIGRLSPAEVERMYRLKTTRYTIEGPMVLGAMLAGAPELRPALADAAASLGLAFQICNDLDAFRRFEISDAVPPDDFVEGKKTLLMTTAFGQLDESDRRLLQICLGQRPASDATLATLRDLVVKSRAVSHLERRIAELTREGNAALARHDIDPRIAAALSDGLSFVAEMVQCPQVRTTASTAI